MRHLLHWDDFVETWIKLRQRGARFIVSKFTLNAHRRTTSAFIPAFSHANWWIIPHLRARENELITGDAHQTYEAYISTHFLSPFSKVAHSPHLLVSLGCGAGSHELRLAALNPTWQIIGYDLSDALISVARQKAQAAQLHNIRFEVADIAHLSFAPLSVSCFLFHAALHHFPKVEQLLETFIKPALVPQGLVVVYEYVGPNRLQLPSAQLATCTRYLREVVPLPQRKILHLSRFKNRCYRTGWLRMWLSDPSECVDSAAILPALRKHFTEVHYTALGGNILMPVLKHIAHHFIGAHTAILDKLIAYETEYLQTRQADFIFGIYQKN